MRCDHGVRCIPPETETQTTFLGVIDMPMINEGIHQWQTTALFPGIGISGSLKRLSLKVQQGMETLFGKDNATRFAFA